MRTARILSFSCFVLLAAACDGGSDRSDGGAGDCIEDVPFALDQPLDQAEADRIATELGVASIEGECEAACMYLAGGTSPDGATFTATQVDECTLQMPSTDGAGDPVEGFVRCEGAGERCEP